MGPDSQTPGFDFKGVFFPALELFWGNPSIYISVPLMAVGTVL